MKNETKKRIKTICKDTYEVGVIAIAVASGFGAGFAAASLAGDFVSQNVQLHFANDNANKILKGIMVLGTAEAVGITVMDKSANSIAKAFNVEV